MAVGDVLDKTSNQPSKLRAFFNRRNLAGLLGAAVAGPGLRLGLPGMVVGYVACRWIYSKTEQFVPFTKRRHIILMPSVAEAVLGAHLYESFLIEQHKKGTLLDASHPDTTLVVGVAQRLIAVLGQGHGGGYQKHLRNFKWSVSVVKEQVMNAFVFPGGYIVVYTGLLQLLRRDPDLLAMVMGHEIGHALARHNTEKMGMGLALSMISSMAMVMLGAGPDEQQQKQRQQELELERMRRGYHRTHSRLVTDAAAAAGSSSGAAAPWGSSGYVPPGASAAGYYPEVPKPDLPPIHYDPRQQQQHQMRQRKGKPAADPDAPPQLPPWMSEQLLRSLTNVLLELPFSRRAETEADLIGLKLMALAGFNAAKGPEAFKLLASVSEGSRKGGAESLIAGLGCTHPDSNRRAELLQKELSWMAANKAEARDAVGSKVNYWSL
uniref:Peptidase M48 domain-containing protein n=1 Tax=Tetradesmus obliquus TaxID=3088 RepID=A0A383VI33_TETOB|eukprot:jgi/Sobl393_1/17246/SZX65175.1